MGLTLSRNIKKFSIFCAVLLSFSLLNGTSLFAANPPAPFLPSDKVLDPNCLPTDSNCYVSVASLSFDNATATNFINTNGTSTNFFSSVLRSLSSFFTNLVVTNSTTTNGTITNLTAGNATITNATIPTLNTTNINALGAIFTNASATSATILGTLYDGTQTGGSAGMILLTTGTSTRWVATSSLGIASTFFSTTTINGLATSTFILGVGNSGTDFTVATSSSGVTFNLPDAATSSRGVVTALAQSFGGIKTFLSGIVTNTLTATGDTYLASTTITGLTVTRSTTTNAIITNSTTTNSSVTNLSVSNATATNFYTNNFSASNLSATGITATNATTTNFVTSNSSTTNATSTNFFAGLFNSITSFITNLTTTNATTTNLAVTSITAGSIPFIGAGGRVSQNNSSLYWDSVNTSLGIGTNTPNATLAVRGTGSSNLLTVASSSGATLFTILANGNVGIGTTSPTTKFEVNGTITANDFITKGPYIDVRAYGAKGDGTTDDRAAISAAFLANPNGRIYFPAGTYLINNGSGYLTLTDFNGEVYFAGKSTLLFSDNSKGGLRFFRGVNARIYNIRTEYQTLPNVRTDLHPVLVENATGTIFTGVSIDGSPGAGLLFSESNNPKVSNIEIKNTMADGLHFAETNNPQVTNLTTLNTGDDGLAFVDYNSANIGGNATNISIKNSGSRGISVIGQSNVTVSNFDIDGTKSSGVIVAEDTTYSTRIPANVVISNGLVRNAGTLLPSVGNTYGIEYTDVTSVTFANIKIFNSNDRAISGSASAGTILLRDIYATSNIDGPGIVVSGQTVDIDGVRLENIAQDGINIVNSDTVIAKNITAENVSISGGLNRAVWFENNNKVLADGITVIDTQGSATGYIVGEYSNTTGVINNIQHSITNGQFEFENNSPGIKFGTANANYLGNLGVGTTTPDYRLSVGSGADTGVVARFQNSTGYCDINPTTTSLTCTSDARLKKNIISLTSDNLAKLTQLNPVTYNWISETDRTSPHAGLIAQEVQALFPDLVATDKNGTLSVAYSGFIPYIIESIKELALEVKDFGVKLTSFRERVDTNTICLGGDADKTCITKSQLDTLLRNSGQSSSPAANTSETTSSSQTETTVTTTVQSDIQPNSPTEESSLGVPINEESNASTTSSQ